MERILSLAADDLEALARRARDLAPLADAVEFRLDALSGVRRGELPTAAELAEAARGLASPWTAACHRAGEPGVVGGALLETDARLELYRRAAAAGAAFVDVPLDLAPGVPSLPGGTRRILSRHLGAVPTNPGDALAELQRAARPGDRLKFVTAPEDAVDLLRLLLALERHVAGGGAPASAFATGVHGLPSRILAPLFGAAFVLLAPPAGLGVPTAVGQPALDVVDAAWPEGGVDSSTRFFGVAGSTARHSLSPAVQGAALRARGVNAVYVHLETADLDALLDLVAEHPRFGGLSVTAPHKEAALRRAAVADETSLAAGAANTLVRTKQGLSAFNSDVSALVSALSRARTGARSALVIGAGGAARAALLALQRLDWPRTVAARRVDQAKLLAETFGARAVALEDLDQVAFDVLVQTTPLGSSAHPGELAFEGELPPGCLVLDAVYRPLNTPLLRKARANGCEVVSGADWFLRQAAEQVRRFYGCEPPEDAMTRAFFEALAAEL